MDESQRRGVHDRRGGGPAGKSGPAEGRSAPCGWCGIRQQTFDPRRDFAAVDEGTDRLGERRHRRCESRDLDERGRQRAARHRASWAAIRSARCSAADAQRRSIARAAGVAVNRSGVARISSRVRLSRAREWPTSCAMLAASSSSVSAATRPRVTSSRGRSTPTSAISGVSMSISETGMPLPAIWTSRLHPDARAPDGTAPRAHAADDGRDQQRGGAKSQSRQRDVETLDEVARFVLPVRRHEDDADEEQGGRGRQDADGEPDCGRIGARPSPDDPPGARGARRS